MPAKPAPPSPAAARTRARHERFLLELTGLPTAAGREQRVVAWIERWAARRPHLRLRRDRFGNLMLQRDDARSRQPIVLGAHMDHPAFVVTGVNGRRVEAEFRGGVGDAYFEGSPVALHPATGAVQSGRVVSLDRGRSDRGDQRVTAEFDRAVTAEPGDVMTWRLPEPRVRAGRLHAPACDDLAAVAAAIAAYERLARPGPASQPAPPDVRLLLTRAEEVGFVGALGVCRSGLIPKRARIVALENSKSFAESPLGGGPIVRVGDRTSTFDPELTGRVAEVAGVLEQRDAARRRAGGPGFVWQRRLMPGGTCEASAYQAMGYTATCVCLPLANYHNMDEAAGRIAPEVIDVADYHHLVRLLVHLGLTLDDPGAAGGTLRERLDRLFEARRGVLTGA